MADRQFATLKFETETFGKQTHELWLPLDQTQEEIDRFLAEMREQLLPRTVIADADE